MKPTKLEGNVIDYIRKGIKSIGPEKGECSGAALCIHLKKNYPKYFRHGSWGGCPTFKGMLDTGSKHFAYYHKDEAKTDLWVRLIESKESEPASSVSQSSLKNEMLAFPAYIKEKFTAEDCRALREEIMGTYDECFTNDCVLRTKLIYMYHKAESEGVLTGEKGLGQVIHTGLYKNSTDPIYMIWTNFNDGRHTHLFLTESSREFRELKRALGNKIPQCPTFEKLTFDSNLEIEAEYGHIIKERYKRIPKNVFEMLRNNPELPEELKEKDDEVLAIKCYNYLRRHLTGCIADTKDRLINESDEPVRYWHKASNKMCWLIPLRFGIGEQVDLALVLDHQIFNGKDIYQGCTILPVKDAFKAARVVGKVSADWLKDSWRE